MKAIKEYLKEIVNHFDKLPILLRGGVYLNLLCVTIAIVNMFLGIRIVSTIITVTINIVLVGNVIHSIRNMSNNFKQDKEHLEVLEKLMGGMELLKFETELERKQIVNELLNKIELEKSIDLSEYRL